MLGLFDLARIMVETGNHYMGSFGGFYSGEKKKKKKDFLEKQAMHIPKVYVPPKVEIIGKGKKNKWV